MTATMLNGAIALGSDKERKSLYGFIDRVRTLQNKTADARFDLLEECARFDESGIWRLYGTWTFGRVLREECGVKVAHYEVYKSALHYLSAKEAREMGLPALRELRRVMREVQIENQQGTGAALYAAASVKINAHIAEHGFSPTARGSLAIIRQVAIQFGISATGAKKDGLRRRFEWLVHTLEQIESISDEGSAARVLARNALDRVSGKTASKQPLAERSASA